MQSTEHSSWHHITIDRVLRDLKSSRQGLDSIEALRRQRHYGKNILPSEPPLSTVVVLLRQFRSILVIILVIAGVLSLGLGERIDFYVIMVTVGLNVGVGFIQEWKAERALASLKKVVIFEAEVLRDGQRQRVSAEQLVPGDVVFVEAGEKIPADGRLLSVVDCEVSEAALTGESASVKKQLKPLPIGTGLADRSNMLFLGTLVTAGSARVVVTCTGLDTEIGSIAGVLKATSKEQTPLQKKFDAFSRSIGLIILGVTSLVLIGGVFSNVPFITMFNLAVALAVSSIPEGLVVAMTVVLAIGAQRILKHHALIRKLVAAETLGSTTVICTDKTGTLTEGRMTVTEVLTRDERFDVRHGPSSENRKGKEELDWIITTATLSNNAVLQNPEADPVDWNLTGNLTDRALLSFGMRHGKERALLEKEMPRVAELPFDSEKKYMVTQHTMGEDTLLIVKGAPEIILNMCDQVRVGIRSVKMSPENRKMFQQKVLTMSKSGLRVLAIADRRSKGSPAPLDHEHPKQTNLVFLGLIGIKDPLRPTAQSTIQLCKEAGITPVMITGDHRMTAAAIGRELGLKTGKENIVEGWELDEFSDEELKKKVKDISIYARVTPRHKLRIIDAWQARHEVVAMTGDGINDAPALKSADIGVALGSGTEVAKEVSDLVLLDNNFSTIVAAVEQGRVIFDNIKKVTLYLLSDSFTEILLVVASLFLGIPLPLSVVQILWINLVTDGLSGFALTLEPKEPKIMQEKPKGRFVHILDLPMKSLIGVISVMLAIENLLLFIFFWKTTGSEDLARTIVFACLGVNTLLIVFSVRSLRRSLFGISFFSNPWLLAAVGLGIGVQLLGIYLPFFQKFLNTVALGGEEWGMILLSSLLVLTLIEVLKSAFIIPRFERTRT